MSLTKLVLLARKDQQGSNILALKGLPLDLTSNKNACLADLKSAATGKRKRVLERSQGVEKIIPGHRTSPSSLSGRKTTKDEKSTSPGPSFRLPERAVFIAVDTILPQMFSFGKLFLVTCNLSGSDFKAISTFNKASSRGFRVEQRILNTEVQHSNGVEAAFRKSTFSPKQFCRNNQLSILLFC